MRSNAPQRLFEGLPFDIHFEVVRHLDFMSALNMASTNRFFHRILNLPAILPNSELVEFIRERGMAGQNRAENLFACYQCYRLRPREKFSKKATADRLHHRHKLTEEGRRYCFDCSAKNRFYDHLRPISNGKLRYYFCHNCGQYRTRSGMCHGPRRGIDQGDGEMLAWCQPKPATPEGGLEMLPAHILKNIVSYLGYDDALHLAMVSHTLRDTVPPIKWVALHTRFRFLRDRWTADTVDVDIGAMKTFPCYMCCRIQPKDKFTPTQLRMAETYPQTSWKMRCQACVQRMYISERNLMRIEYNRRRMCEICKCLRRGRETCGGCLELYVKGAIDQRTMYPEGLGRKRDYGDHLNRLDGLFDGQDWVEA
ncbi:hypothetical protein BKA56DRAFT_672805 [Ilyonectria sp. MPI-CAGE-AT-0026]|nr:hypothetical protein BKA56DRAFT_672805 [Ilyonectria sp. MPI-CAGE-AT-0026]